MIFCRSSTHDGEYDFDSPSKTLTHNPFDPSPSKSSATSKTESEDTEDYERIINAAQDDTTKRRALMQLEEHRRNKVSKIFRTTYFRTLTKPRVGCPRHFIGVACEDVQASQAGIAAALCCSIRQRIPNAKPMEFLYSLM
jgi:hypothetical protein